MWLINPKPSRENQMNLDQARLHRSLGSYIAPDPISFKVMHVMHVCNFKINNTISLVSCPWFLGPHEYISGPWLVHMHLIVFYWAKESIKDIPILCVWGCMWLRSCETCIYELYLSLVRWYSKNFSLSLSLSLIRIWDDNWKLSLYAYESYDFSTRLRNQGRGQSMNDKCIN
jgi:hypothetical protein